ncbi:MAG TPA: pentapeptide repeat-containing protein, partial [Herpetosiphonaceae bacterium]|nr:pentapeptide repeat-containing protein [Herpetosiphonaceae bacterium]
MGQGLASAPWWNPFFEGTNLQFAQLAGARLGSANLQGASLAGANLPHARLTHADLRGAVLRNADLQHASLASARLLCGRQPHEEIIRAPDMVLTYTQVWTIRSALAATRDP